MKKTVGIDDLYEMFPECMVDELIEQMIAFGIKGKEAEITVSTKYREEIGIIQEALDAMSENATEAKEELDFFEDESSFDSSIIEKFPEVNLVEIKVEGFIFKEWKPP